MRHFFALIAALIGLSSTLGAQDTFTPLYVVQGIIAEDSSRNGNSIRSADSPFTFAIDEKGRWKMSLETYIARHDITTTNLISYNGTDIFSILYSDKHFDGNHQVVRSPPPESSEHPGRVARGPFPLDHGECVGFLWLAFVGGDFTARHPSNALPNLLASDARRNPVAWSSDFQFKLLAGAPNPLIASGVFVPNPRKASDNLLSYPEIDEPENAESADRVARSLRALRAADGPKLSSEMVLLESAMIGKIRVPTRFTATTTTTFSQVDAAVRVLECRVTNIVTNCPVSEVLPKLLGSTFVEDRRFMQRTKTYYRNNIFYKLDKTGWIVSTNDSKFRGPNGFLPGLMVRRSFIATTFSYIAAAVVLVSVLVLLGMLQIRRGKRT